MKIHQFDPVIYPVLLWILDEVDVEEIRKSFQTVECVPLIFTASEGGIAYTQNKVVCKDGDYGVLVVLADKNRMTVGTMAHEATHAARCIWDHLLEENTGGEADAYLVQWVAECMEIVKLDNNENG
jgi:hypothetical protein